MSITSKDAALAAQNYLMEIVGSSNKLTGLLIEEIEQEGDYWLITLGYNKPLSGSAGIIFNNNMAPLRDYKLFKVNKYNGAVESMKIRTF